MPTSTASSSKRGNYDGVMIIHIGLSLRQLAGEDEMTLLKLMFYYF